MISVRSRSGVPVRLTDERWRHIAQRHPERADERRVVLHALSDPDLIPAGGEGSCWPSALMRTFRRWAGASG
ncbi:MAG: hypothetical protein AVDCRST_MAG49-4554 [uncultured Thermomicrobiales bacterium]|uniref:Uncharacterized protein n=1 Tax=uncultured Thermomicrobiales bacterium TaxID=1645740 RepID=A0A6J4VIG5_9BACT|nr:MAG: hypothetical protein AVDCRST_MAG49-4554 [uncultured Thermomicrobiales bacterium]